MKVSNSEDTVRESCLNLGLLPEMLRPQMCIKSRRLRRSYREAEEAAVSSTSWAFSKTSERPKPRVHIPFLRRVSPNCTSM